MLMRASVLLDRVIDGRRVGLCIVCMDSLHNSWVLCRFEIRTPRNLLVGERFFFLGSSRLLARYCGEERFHFARRDGIDGGGLLFLSLFLGLGLKGRKSLVCCTCYEVFFA